MDKRFGQNSSHQRNIYKAGIGPLPTDAADAGRDSSESLINYTGACGMKNPRKPWPVLDLTARCSNRSSSDSREEKRQTRKVSEEEHSVILHFTLRVKPADFISILPDIPRQKHIHHQQGLFLVLTRRLKM